MILAPDDRHKEVFPDVPLIGFKNNKSLRDHLVRSQLPDIKETGKSEPCGGKRPPCDLCKNMKITCTFKSKHFNEVYKINNDYNCNSKMAVYLIECRVCGEQYTGCTKTKFLSRANNYKSTHRKFINKKEVIITMTIIVIITIFANIHSLVINISAKTVHCLNEVSFKFLFSQFLYLP